MKPTLLNAIIIAATMASLPVLAQTNEACTAAQSSFMTTVAGCGIGGNADATSLTPQQRSCLCALAVPGGPLLQMGTACQGSAPVADSIQQIQTMCTTSSATGTAAAAAASPSAAASSPSSSPSSSQSPSAPSPTSVSATGAAPGSAPASICTTAQEAFMAGVGGCQIPPNADISSINPQQAQCLCQVAGIGAGGPIDAIDAECVGQADVLAASQRVHTLCTSALSAPGAPAGPPSAGGPPGSTGPSGPQTTGAQPSGPSGPSGPQPSGPSGPTGTGNVVTPTSRMDQADQETDNLVLTPTSRMDQVDQVDQVDQEDQETDNLVLTPTSRMDQVDQVDQETDNLVLTPTSRMDQVDQVDQVDQEDQETDNLVLTPTSRMDQADQADQEDQETDKNNLALVALPEVTPTSNPQEQEVGQMHHIL
ncbi:hypothetical protein HDU81_003395 [Chytriomyces hyalinus]|nr:hypothetical protein HDU81_003395 [Chytriomyces hyalinus]